MKTGTREGEGVVTSHVAPDGGWGWVVCGATFVCLAINEGLAFIFGLLYVDLLDYYREDPGLTATVGSAYLGTHMIVGPVVGAMIKCCGSRLVAMLGGLLAGLAVALSILSPNMTVMIFVFGIGAGTAVGMVFLPAVLTVGFYFDKRRGIAYGIASSGTGFGTSVFSALYTSLEKTYTWKGAVLILGGIMLNCIVCGALYRPLKNRGPRSSQTPSNAQMKFKAVDNGRKSTSVYVIPASEGAAGAEASCTTRSTSKKDVGVHPENAFQDQFDIDSDPPPSAVRRPKGARSRVLSLSRELSRLLGLGMLLEPAFLLVSLIMALWVCFSTLLTILPHYSILIGFSDAQASLLVTVMGVTNVLGRLVFGYVADKWLSAIWVYMGVLFVGSISSFLIPFTTNYGCLMVEAAAFGASFGTCLSLRQVVLLDLLGLNKLINAFGLVSMFQGITYLIGPPIAGKLYKHTHSYKEPFLLISAAYALAAVLCIPIGRIIKQQRLRLFR